MRKRRHAERTATLSQGILCCAAFLVLAPITFRVESVSGDNVAVRYDDTTIRGEHAMAPPRKREDQMLGRPKRQGVTNATQVALNVDASTVLPVPALIVASPHPLVITFWESLRVSPMRVYWQETDWAAAQMAAYLLQGVVTSPRPSSTMVAEINRTFDMLGMTEIQRRKGGIEIERRAEEDTTAADSAEEEYRRALGLSIVK